MAGFVYRLGITDLGGSVAARWNTRLDTLGLERCSEFVRVIALVADHVRSRRRQAFVDQLGADVIASLPFGQQQDDRLSASVDDGMQLRVQAAFRSSDTAGNIPFLSRLAAVR